MVRVGVSCGNGRRQRLTLSESEVAGERGSNDSTSRTSGVARRVVVD